MARSARQRRGGQARRRCSTLAALGASALAIPGLAGPAAGDTPPEQWSADYNVSFYAENDLDAGKLAAGSAQRYEIDTQQLRFGGPLSERSDLDVYVTHETMSGASPWFVEADADGDPVQVMSGASIEETRTDILVRTSRYFERGRGSLLGGYSWENDYRAINGGLSGERHFRDKNRTLSFGLGFSLDEIEPTDADLFATRPAREDKQSYSVFAGISEILSRNAAVQSTLTVQHAQGFLSDPYKLVSVSTLGNVADRRPDQRTQVAWLTRYRHHFSELDGTLHADYRFYVDDWEITSHTLELAWYQALGDAIQLVPSLRYYSQSQAEFYGPFFSDLPAGSFASSDYRLSPFGALSWKLKALVRLPDLGRSLRWNAALTWERYVSSGDLALGQVEIENPGLVSYNLFMVRLAARF